MARLLAVFVIVTHLIGCEERSFTPEPASAPANPAVAGRGGLIHGRVMWAGPRPVVPPLTVSRLQGDVSTVQYLSRANPHTPRIAADGGLAGAVVYVRFAGPSPCRVWDHPPVAVSMHDCGPIVRQGEHSGFAGFVRRGDMVHFENPEARMQVARARGAAFFSLTLPPGMPPRCRPLTELGRVEVSSGTGDIHLRGHLFVAEHPYFTLTDESGRFEIPDVPKGNHEIVAWHPNWHVLRYERDPESLIRVRAVYRPAFESHRIAGVGPGPSTGVTLTLHE
ncbi:MAG: hypothetical protein K1X57_12405 [Gemmataceae bacterium]|nr:hypothetical protein [Gemmataceae bacterium]